MAQSHLTVLDDNLKSASKIVSKVPPHGCNTELQELCLKAYILLSHAALEVYFEDACLNAATEAVGKYKNSGTITKSLLGLVSSKVLRDVRTKNAKKLASDAVSNIAVFSTEALTAYAKRVKDNNGIKGENIRSLLVPVGVEPEVEEISAFNALNTFGTSRGDIAHKFLGIKTQHTLSSVNSSLKTIRDGIDVYEAALSVALS